MATKKPTRKSAPRPKASPKASLKASPQDASTPPRKRKPATKKSPPGFTLEPATATVTPAPSHDDIALRAYFIAERRRQMGWHGDAHGDWAEAEAQLRAEAMEEPLKKR
jgi:hypothetical protein